METSQMDVTEISVDEFKKELERLKNEVIHFNLTMNNNRRIVKKRRPMTASEAKNISGWRSPRRS
tara:strand:- start:509 stop:703 length:195 start_codon:yes stop_codon:yes gene_type:complete